MKPLDQVEARSNELRQQLTEKIAAGQLGMGELSPIMRELDFLRALKDELKSR